MIANFIYVVFAIAIFALAIMSMSYTIEKCGFMNALFLGKGGFYAAYSGMCDNK